MHSNDILAQYTVSKETASESSTVGGTAVASIDQESVTVDMSAIDDKPITGIPFSFSRCGLTRTPNSEDKRLPAFAPNITNFSYGAFPFTDGGFLYIYIEKRAKPQGDGNNWCEYCIYNYPLKDTTRYAQIIWKSFDPSDTTAREPDEHGRGFIEFYEGDVVWLAYSETQWSSKQVLNIMKDEAAIKKRFQKIDVDDWLEKNPISDISEEGKKKIETKILPDDENSGYYYTYGVTMTPKNDATYAFPLNDPLGAADDISNLLTEDLLQFDAFLASLKTSKSQSFKYGELVNSHMGTYQDYYKNLAPDKDEDQYVALFDTALILNSVLLNEDILSFADLKKNESKIKENIRTNIKHENPAIAEEELEKEALNIFKTMEDKYDDMEKYIERISPEKVRKLLGYDERAVKRNKIIALRDSLGQMLKSTYYQNCLIDYYNNDDDRFLTGQLRLVNHLKILHQRPWDKETFIDPDLADTIDNLKDFIDEVTDLQDDVFENLDYLDVDSGIKDTVIHTVFLSKSKIINVAENIDKTLDMIFKMNTFATNFIDILTYSKRNGLMRIASKDEARNYRKNVQAMNERLIYATQEYLTYDKALSRRLQDAIEIVKEHNKDLTTVVKDKKLQKFVIVEKNVKPKYTPVNRKPEFIKEYSKILDARRKTAYTKVDAADENYEIVRGNKDNLKNFVKTKQYGKNNALSQKFSTVLNGISNGLTVYSAVSVVASTINTYVSDNKHFTPRDIVNAGTTFGALRVVLLEAKPLTNLYASEKAYSWLLPKLGIKANRGAWMIRKGFILGRICGIGVSAVFSIIMIWDGFSYMSTDNPNKGWVNIIMGLISLTAITVGVAVMGSAFVMSMAFNVATLIVALLIVIINYLLSWDPFERFLYSIALSKRLKFTNPNQPAYIYRRYLVQYRRDLALPYTRDELNYNKDSGVIYLSNYTEMYRWMINMMVNLSVTVRYNPNFTHTEISKKLLNKVGAKGSYYYMEKRVIDIRYMDSIPDTHLELKMKLLPRGLLNEKALNVALDVDCSKVHDSHPYFLPVFQAPTNVKGMAYKECHIDFEKTLLKAFEKTNENEIIYLDKCRYIMFIRLVSNSGASVWPASESKEPLYMAISEKITLREDEYKNTNILRITYYAKSRYVYTNAPQGRFYINDKAVYYGTEEEIYRQVAEYSEKGTLEQLEKMDLELISLKEQRKKEADKWPLIKKELTDPDKDIESHKLITGGL